MLRPCQSRPYLRFLYRGFSQTPPARSKRWTFGRVASYREKGSFPQESRVQRIMRAFPFSIPATHRYTSGPFACLEKSRRPGQGTSPDKAKGLQDKLCRFRKVMFSAQILISYSTSVTPKSGTWYFPVQFRILPALRSISVCLTGQPNPLCVTCIVNSCFG